MNQDLNILNEFTWIQVDANIMQIVMLKENVLIHLVVTIMAIFI